MPIDNIWDILGRNKKKADTRTQEQKVQDALDRQTGGPQMTDRQRQNADEVHRQDREGYTPPAGLGAEMGAPKTAREKFQERVAAGQQKPKRAKRKKSPPGDHANDKVIQQLHARYEGKPEHQKLIHDLSTRGHNEPYFGPDVTNVAYGDADRDLPQQFPARVTEHGGVIGKGVPSGSGPDPLAWMDNKYGVTKRLLERERGKPLDIHTRSDLGAHDDYMAAMDPKNHRVHIHLPGHNDRIARVLEPGAPSVRRRIEAANKLAEAGHDVTLIHDKFHGPEGKDLSHLNQMNRFELPVKPHPRVKFAENLIHVSPQAADKMISMTGDPAGFSKPESPKPTPTPGGKPKLSVAKSQGSSGALGMLQKFKTPL